MGAASTVNYEVLQGFVHKLFARTGMPDEDSRTCAEYLVKTNLWGIDSHGVLRVPIYIKRLLSGAMNKTPEITSASNFGAIEILNGDDGCGCIVG